MDPIFATLAIVSPLRIAASAPELTRVMLQLVALAGTFVLAIYPLGIAHLIVNLWNEVMIRYDVN